MQVAFPNTHRFVFWPSFFVEYSSNRALEIDRLRGPCGMLCCGLRRACVCALLLLMVHGSPPSLSKAHRQHLARGHNIAEPHDMRRRSENAEDEKVLVRTVKEGCVRVLFPIHYGRQSSPSGHVKKITPAVCSLCVFHPIHVSWNLVCTFRSGPSSPAGVTQETFFFCSTFLPSCLPWFSSREGFGQPTLLLVDF